MSKYKVGDRVELVGEEWATVGGGVTRGKVVSIDGMHDGCPTWGSFALGIPGWEIRPVDEEMTELLSDPVNHPSHYTSDPLSAPDVEYNGSHASTSASFDRNEVHPIDGRGSGVGAGEESEVGGGVRLRESIGGVRAQPVGRENEKLRMPEEGADILEREGKDLFSGLRIPENTRASEGESAHGASARAHSCNGVHLGAPLATWGGSASPECEPSGQSAGEPGVVESQSSGRGEGGRSSEVGRGGSETLRARAVAGHDPVDSPAHYRSDPSGIECIQITRHRNFSVGNAIKYLWRAGLKDDPAQDAVDKQIEDLRKAIFYINDEIDRLS